VGKQTLARSVIAHRLEEHTADAGTCPQESLKIRMNTERDRNASQPPKKPRSKHGRTRNASSVAPRDGEIRAGLDAVAEDSAS